MTSKHNLLTVVRTGQAGRPTKHLNTNWVQDAVSSTHHITLGQLASLLGIHRNTLRYKLRRLGLHKQFSAITDNELDNIIKTYKRLRPTSGLRYTTGFLRCHDLQIQREHIRKSLQRIDGLGHTLRRHDAIMRRTYVSQVSNAVWHLDSLHKLIQYDFVIHGTVDGHDHVVSEFVFENLLPNDTCTGCGVTRKYKQ